jgi:predicted transcriptional regulator
LLEEREKLAEIKKKIEDLNLSCRLTGINEKRMERFWKVVSLLQENSRMSLMEMSKKLKIPVSTLFDTLKEVEKIFKLTIVLKDKERKV